MAAAVDASSSRSPDIPTSVQLDVLLDQCKFYPLHKRCVLAGTISSIANHKESGGNDKCSSGDRCLVYYSEETAAQMLVVGCSSNLPPSIYSLMEKWNTLECGNHKCTGWIRLIVPFVITCHFSSTTTPTLKQSPQRKTGRNNNNNNSCPPPPTAPCWIWDNCIHITSHFNPMTETIHLTFALEQAKFYSTKLLVLDGSVVESIRDDDGDDFYNFDDNDNNNRDCWLPPGERCWVHVRSGTKSLLKQLQPKDDDSSSIVNKTFDPTGWMQLTKSSLVHCRLWRTQNDDDDHPSPLRNQKTGAVLLECYDIIDITFPTNNEMNDCPTTLRRLGDRSFQGNKNDSSVLPALRDRKERHLVFAQWLVEKFGIEMLSNGSGVLDVAGGKGELCQALLDLGVPNATLLDPDPRCKIDQVKFQVIAKSLLGDASDLTSSEDERISRLVTTCSMMVGLHPDGATEAIIDTSLRLGVPFAILPCCFSQKLFPERKKNEMNKEYRDVNHYKSYSIFCQHLLNMAPVGMRFEVENLPFQGRNKVIYFSTYACQIAEQ
ncbi:hypothetical protein IV203_016374 [Nitzschia inconspicua]|uniref:Methyltransferase domain-containing protein n=1 Tax=Nitzschia inconspicua TaxID=303405 RepID=A0A9K3K4U7_9STRA|nr:hypothetical protein IV203_017429 [Nitzschia inconspicua]KAG7347669.1 hypothetical protein IV203_016374 [Nitzschia inconspicua]